MEELAGTSLEALEALALKGSPRANTCQVAIRTLRATAALGGSLRRAAAWSRCRGGATGSSAATRPGRLRPRPQRSVLGPA
jgi:hypothetical protein